MRSVAFIRKSGDEYFVYSQEGKKLSKGYKTREEALKRMREIEYFKHQNANATNEDIERYTRELDERE